MNKGYLQAEIQNFLVMKNFFVKTLAIPNFYDMMES